MSRHRYTTRHPLAKYSLVILAALFALTGCGQKGPLYLPQPEQPTQEQQAQ